MYVQLLMTVLTCGETTEMMTLAITAAQCMNKVAISREVREFTHKGKAEGKLKESVSFFNVFLEAFKLFCCYFFL